MANFANSFGGFTPTMHRKLFFFFFFFLAA
jgi:hypothetical protein